MPLGGSYFSEGAGRRLGAAKGSSSGGGGGTGLGEEVKGHFFLAIQGPAWRRLAPAAASHCVMATSAGLSAPLISKPSLPAT